MEPYTRTEALAAGVLSHEVFQKIRRECEADILIGIPTYNNAWTIGNVLQAVRTGLAHYFPDQKAVILESDASSTDGTVEIVRNSVTRRLPVYIVRHRERTEPADPDPLHSIPSRAAALRAIFETAVELGVRACLVLDADLISISPAWIERLVMPVINDRCDYVSPLYQRNKCDSMITSMLLYPLARALYGKRIRQPIGGNFCVSGRLAKFYLRKRRAETDNEAECLDHRLVIEAITNNFKMAQAVLGPRIRNNRSASEVHAVLPRILRAAFDLTESGHQSWKSVRGSAAVPVFGIDSDTDPRQMQVEVDDMLRVFRQGVRDLKDIWLTVLGELDYGLLEYLAFRSEGRFTITSTLWARMVYDYAIAYHQRKLSAGHLLKSFTPLYLGKAVSHLQEVQDKGHRGTEDEIERICVAFEEGKDHLIRNWKE